MSFLNLLRVVAVSALLFTSANAQQQCRTPRVRREWRSISTAERTSWIKAVQCMAKLPHDPNMVATVDPALSLIPPIDPDSTYFDDFAYAHMDLNVLIHGTGFFLPWHRLYLQTFEDVLKTKCGYIGVQPYWDWTQDAADFEHATIFSNSTTEGLGWWGAADDDFQIFTGGLKDIELAYPVPHNIRRNYTLQPFLAGLNAPGAPAVDPQLMINTTFTQANVDFTVNSFTGNYSGFQAYFENIAGPHPGAHLILGGDMSGLCPFGLAEPDCYPGMRWSSNDPMFYLHHAMVDKIWYDWQLRDASNANAFEGGSVSGQVDITVVDQYPNGGPPFLNLSSPIPGDALWGTVPISDVMSTVGGRLCYTYA